MAVGDKIDQLVRSVERHHGTDGVREVGERRVEGKCIGVTTKAVKRRGALARCSVPCR
jgi:hypothetical protein